MKLKMASDKGFRAGVKKGVAQIKRGEYERLEDVKKELEHKLGKHEHVELVHVEHEHCAHICKQCDIACCCKCPKEWRAQVVPSIWTGANGTLGGLITTSVTRWPQAI